MIDTLIPIISNVGFPIAMCLFLATTMKQTQEKLTDAVNNNNALMSMVLEKLDIKPPQRPTGAL